MSEVIGTAKANPTKAFFVRMITRDITLEDSILDLIDNSVGGACKTEGKRPIGLAQNVRLAKYNISITANENKFIISDDCGGMSLDDARNYAFSFGRRDNRPSNRYSIGVYGIGMKRAVFKLGKKIAIKSTTVGKNNRKMGFEVPINVDEWLETLSETWNFDIVKCDPDTKKGVVISASQLTSATRSEFKNPAFIQRLRRTIARDYALHLNQGLTIEVNGKKVEASNIAFKSGKEIKPVRFDYVDRTDGRLVAVEIIGGMADAPPNSLDPSGKKERRDPYGWYIICNGRVVLAADKTEISGWGVRWPKWHPQYTGFIGLLVFSAKNAADLPLTTTKRSVDQASSVFRKAGRQLEEISKTWIDYTSRRKAMNRGSMENKSEVERLETATKSVSVYNVEKQEVLVLPKLGQPASRKTMANIAYSVPVTRARALARGFGDASLSYREIGLKSFEYAYEDLAEEN